MVKLYQGEEMISPLSMIFKLQCEKMSISIRAAFRVGGTPFQLEHTLSFPDRQDL